MFLTVKNTDVIVFCILLYYFHDICAPKIHMLVQCHQWRKLNERNASYDVHVLVEN